MSIFHWFLDKKHGGCVHLQLWSPFWKIKSTKLQLEISGTLNHKLHLLIDFSIFCFCNSLKTLFEPANSTFIKHGILKRILKSASRGILALHRGAEGWLSEVKRRLWSKLSNMKMRFPKMRFPFLGNSEHRKRIDSKKSFSLQLSTSLKEKTDTKREIS